MNLPSYPNTKKSNYPWLGAFPAHWAVKRLRFATERIEQGWSPQCDNQVADGDTWGVMKVGCVNGDHFDASENKALPPELDPKTEYELRPGDVLISRANTRELVGSAAIVPSGVRSKLLLCDKLFRIALCPEVDTAYLTFCLRTPAARFQYEQDATGASGSMQNIGQDAIKNLVLPFPSYSEQQQIAAFLDWKTNQIDALIAKKQELLQKLKEKRLAVITQAVTKGLNPDAPMRDSGIPCLGVVPVHWKISSIKFALQEPITDGPHETPEFFDDGIPFVSAEAVKNDRLDFDKKRGYISIEDHQRYSKKYRPKRGDVYMVKSGATTGNIARVETDLDFNIWSPLAALRPDLDTATTDFIFYFMKSKPFFYSVEQGWSFGTQQNIGMGVIANLQMAYPPVAEQKIITKQIDRQTNMLDAMSASCIEAITRLTEYRTALITAATTGKIDVRDWQRT